MYNQFEECLPNKYGIISANSDDFKGNQQMNTNPSLGCIEIWVYTVFRSKYNFLAVLVHKVNIFT